MKKVFEWVVWVAIYLILLKIVNTYCYPIYPETLFGQFLFSIIILIGDLFVTSYICQKIKEKIKI